LSVLPFSLRRVSNKRNYTAGGNIILNHSVDFLSLDKSFSPDLKLDYSDKFQFYDYIKLFRSEYAYDGLGFHYYIELFKDNYITLLGQSISSKSEFLMELYGKNLLNRNFNNDILITISGDYSYDVPEKKLYEQLAYLITTLMNEYEIQMGNILLLSDYFDFNKNNKEVMEKRYNITPMKNFDFSELDSFIRKLKIK